MKDPSIETCDFFEAHEKAGHEALLPPGGGRGQAGRQHLEPRLTGLQNWKSPSYRVARAKDVQHVAQPQML